MTGASQPADPSRTGMFTTGIFSRLEKHSAELDLSPERWMPWNYRDNSAGALPFAPPHIFDAALR